MLTVHQLAKSFALKSLFSDVTFSIHAGDRVGLVGPNGCGKSTLIRIIAGQETADSGQVTAAPDLRLGYLPQGFELEVERSLADVVGRAAGDPAALEGELSRLAQALAEHPDNDRLQRQYDDVLQQLQQTQTGRAAAIMAGLGLADVPPQQPVSRLSGGQHTRLQLALVLLEKPNLLLLDEPTNHLDIAMLEWLESWLADFDGGALIVSHDRTFLDRSVSRILALEPLAQTVAAYDGNYTDYADQVALAREKQWAAYRDQQAEIRRVRQDIARAKAQAAYTERQASSVRIGGGEMKQKGFKDYQRSIAKKVAQKAKAREQKLARYLEADERVARPSRTRHMKLELADTAHLGRSVLTLDRMTVGYEAGRPLLQDLRLAVAPGARIVLTGPNGCGKTTLIRTLAGRLPPLAGRLEQGPSVRLGTMTQEQSDIDPDLTPLETVQAGFENETAARTFLSYFLFVDQEPLLPNRRLSYGQRARLALAQLVAAGCNVLLLDEPINHLDIPSREQFEAALGGFAGTVLAVVHDRYFIDRFASEIWWVEDRSIRRLLVQ